MLPRSTVGVVLVATVLLGAAACASSGTAGGVTRHGGGTPSTGLPAPSSFLAVDARARTVTITLIASYDGTNSGFNFDGYSRELMWTVPRGWTVHVACRNRGPLRHSCAVVRNAGDTQPAFSGAETPQPTIGLEAGTRSVFTFRASSVGVYRLTCLVPGHEAARMWDVLTIARGGTPSVVSLLAK